MWQSDATFTRAVVTGTVGVGRNGDGRAGGSAGTWAARGPEASVGPPHVDTPPLSHTLPPPGSGQSHGRPGPCPPSVLRLVLKLFKGHLPLRDQGPWPSCCCRRGVTLLRTLLGRGQEGGR